MRSWVALNSDIDSSVLYRKLYDSMNEFLDKNYFTKFIVTLGDYHYKSAFVVDQEINTVAFLTQVMADCEFKK